MSTTSQSRLVVIDDEKYICDIIAESLVAEPYTVTTFTDPGAAMVWLGDHPVDLVLTDLVMGERSGVDVLQAARAHHADAVVILMTAHPTVQTAISVLKQGAYDFLVKPFKLEVLKAVIKRGLNHQKIARENLSLRSQVEFLRAAGSFAAGVDLDTYLSHVLASCKTEMGATAAALVEINPDNGRVIRTLVDPDTGEYDDEILSEDLIKLYAPGDGAQPRVSTSRLRVNDRTIVRTLVTSPILVREQLCGVITTLVLDRFERVFPAQLSALSILTNAASAAIANHRLYQELQQSYLQAIRALANAIEARDQHTKGHTDRVIHLALPMAHALGWSSAQIHALVMGCTLHDIGKIGVPDSILNKPDRLTEDERTQMFNHPQVGLKIVSGIDLFKPAIPFIASHHERFDGTGYPKGLGGDAIPIEGRLLAVADTFDAIMSDRPYRRGATLQVAVAEILANSGRQFDPALVSLFLGILREGKVNLRALYGRDEDLSCLQNLTVTETVPA